MNDPRLAPPGGHQLVVVSPCSYQFFCNLRKRNEVAYQGAKEEYGQKIIQILERDLVPDLSRHIVIKVTGSPLTNEFHVRAPQGNIYGIPLDPQHINPQHLSYWSPFPNFFYVGASSGMPGFASGIHFACMLYERLTGDRAVEV